MDLRDHASASLEDVAAVDMGRFGLTRDDGTPEETVFAQVTPNLFGSSPNSGTGYSTPKFQRA